MLKSVLTLLILSAWAEACHGRFKRVDDMWKSFGQFPGFWQPGVQPPMGPFMAPPQGFPMGPPPSFEGHHHRWGFPGAPTDFQQVPTAGNPTDFFVNDQPEVPAAIPQSDTPQQTSTYQYSSENQPEVGPEVTPDTEAATLERLFSGESAVPQELAGLKDTYRRHQAFLDLNDHAADFQKSHAELSAQIEDLETFKNDIRGFKFFEKEAEQVADSLNSVLRSVGLVAGPAISDLLDQIKSTIATNEIFGSEWERTVDRSIEELRQQHQVQEQTLAAQTALVASVQETSEALKELWRQLRQVLSESTAGDAEDIERRMRDKATEIGQIAQTADTALDQSTLHRIKNNKAALESSRLRQAHAVERLKRIEDGLNESREAQAETVKKWIDEAESEGLAQNESVRPKVDQLRTMFVETE